MIIRATGDKVGNGPSHCHSTMHCPPTFTSGVENGTCIQIFGKRRKRMSTGGDHDDRSASNERTILFVANDIVNFEHHRAHLVVRAVAHGMKALVMAGGMMTEHRGTARRGAEQRLFLFQSIQIERFSLHPRDLTLFFAIFWRLLRTKPQIAHFFNIKPYLFGGLACRAARMLGWRGQVIVTVPGLGRLYDAGDQRLQSRLRRQVVEYFLRRAVQNATVTFETERDRNFWMERGLVAIGQTRVTQGAGIDLDRFRAPERKRANGALRVLYAGRLLRTKGLDTFIAASTRGPLQGVEMLVAGFQEEDPDGISIKEIRECPGIHFLGAVEDMPALLQHVDVVVLPSRYNEGIPRILIEAAACGCVPVASDFPGSRALICDGETGYLLHSCDQTSQVIELLELLLRLAGNPQRCHEVGARARLFIEESGFSNQAVSDVFSGLYGRDLWTRQVVS